MCEKYRIILFINGSGFIVCSMKREKRNRCVLCRYYYGKRFMIWLLCHYPASFILYPIINAFSTCRVVFHINRNFRCSIIQILVLCIPLFTMSLTSTYYSLLLFTYRQLRTIQRFHVSLFDLFDILTLIAFSQSVSIHFS